MNVNAQEYLFRGVYVSICSFASLAIYVTSKKYIGESYAFLASFFFISQSVFLMAAVKTRTDLAIFFVALAFMIFFNDKINPLKRRILFIVFMLSVVVSHYSTAYLFFIMMLFSWVAVETFPKRRIFEKKMTLTIVLIFFAFIFFWYSQVTETAFNAGVNFIGDTAAGLNKFFIAESRNQAFEVLYGQGLEYGIISRVNLAVTWSTFIFIGIGVVTLIKRYKEMIDISNVKHKKPDFLKTEFEMEYLVMALACAGLLVIMVALPYVSKGYGIDRMYAMMLVILSVCFIIGGMTLSKYFSFFIKYFLSKERTCAKKECNSFGNAFLSKKRFVLKEKQKSLSKSFSFKKKLLLKKQKKGRKDEIRKGKGNRKSVDGKNGSQVRAYLIILLILIPYFLFVTGAMHQIFGVPVVITLNSGGEAYDRDYIHDQECCTAKWLMMNGEKNSLIYSTDMFGKQRLVSQGEISPNRIDAHSFSKHRNPRGYIYLSYNNVVKGKLATYSYGYVTDNMSEYSDMFIGKSNIYDNAYSEIYK
jgi:uncharacterized membrane protein